MRCVSMGVLQCRWHGLYPLLTMIRHSCCPNSVISYVDESAMLRATLDLAAGQCKLCVFLTHIIIIIICFAG